jgi:preprotein translocase subunit SecB
VALAEYTGTPVALKAEQHVNASLRVNWHWVELAEDTWEVKIAMAVSTSTSDEEY